MTGVVGSRKRRIDQSTSLARSFPLRSTVIRTDQTTLMGMPQRVTSIVYETIDAVQGTVVRAITHLVALLEVDQSQGMMSKRILRVVEKHHQLRMSAIVVQMLWRCWRRTRATRAPRMITSTHGLSGADGTALEVKGVIFSPSGKMLTVCCECRLSSAISRITNRWMDFRWR
jgi:hypothetical protein